MPDTPPHLPELARSLRSFGAGGSAGMDEAHDAVFGPLLVARTAAVNAPVGSIVDVLNGNAILQGIESAVRAAATRGVTNAAHCRALTARAQEATEPLRRCLLALDELAPMTSSDEGWAEWVHQLRRVFATADDTCRALVLVLDERLVTDAPTGWFPRNNR